MREAKTVLTAERFYQICSTEKNTPLAFERVFIVSYYNMEIKVSFFTNSLILAIDKITISDKITTSNLQTHIN